MKSYLFLCFFVVATACCYGQQDSLFMENTSLRDGLEKEVAVDTLVVNGKKHSPALAGGLSAALPGLGQAYNKKYWKIPIDYAGFAAAGSLIYYFNKKYVYYRTAYRHILNDEKDLVSPELQGYNKDNINSMKQYHQKNMEYSIIFLVAWYCINIVDAIVDAHLMSFDVSENLALRIAPDINYNPNLKFKQTVGLSFTLNLKPLNSR